MVMEDYQDFCRRCECKVNTEASCSAESDRKRAPSAIHFHGRPVLLPMLTEEQRIEMAEQRQKAVVRESERYTLRTSSLLVQDIFSHVQNKHHTELNKKVQAMVHAKVEQGAEASSPDTQDLSLKGTHPQDKAPSSSSSTQRRETLRLLNSRMERVEKSREKQGKAEVEKEKTSGTGTQPSYIGDIHCEDQTGEETLSDKENESCTSHHPLVVESNNTFTSVECSHIPDLESCDSPLASLSLSASLMGSYAQLPSPQPSCSPLTHRLRKLYTSGSILISFPITELEINKTNSVQSESHSSENSSNRLTKSKEPLVICPPSEEDGNCSFSELNSKPLLLACNSTTSSSASITSRRPVTLTHTPSPNQPGPVLHRENSRQNHRSLFQRSPPAPLNQSYDVESPAPNMLRPHASPLQRSQHSPEDRNTTGCAADAVQDRGEVLNLKIQLWEEDLTHQFSPLVKAQDGGTQYLQQVTVVSTEQHKAVCYLTAAARGFLTRRLLQTQKIKHLRKTIQDSKELIRSFQADAQQRRASFTHQDLSLQHRVRAQLRAALHSVHEIFFVWPLRTRLALLQQSRELRNERRRREMEKAKSPRDQQGLSSATQKSLERNKQRPYTKIPQKPNNPTTRRVVKRTMKSLKSNP